MCCEVFPSLCALDVHVRFLHGERALPRESCEWRSAGEAAEWQTSRLEASFAFQMQLLQEYIKLRGKPGARRAALPEKGTFTLACTGGLAGWEPNCYAVC